MSMIFLSSESFAYTLDELDPKARDFRNASDLVIGTKQYESGSDDYSVKHYVEDHNIALNITFNGTYSGPITKIYEEHNYIIFKTRELIKSAQGSMRTYTYPGFTDNIYSDFTVELDLEKNKHYYVAYSARENGSYNYKVEYNKDIASFEHYGYWLQDYAYKDEFDKPVQKLYFDAIGAKNYFLFLQNDMTQLLTDYVGQYSVEVLYNMMENLMKELVMMTFSELIPGFGYLSFCISMYQAMEMENRLYEDQVYINASKQMQLLNIAAHRVVEENKITYIFTNGLEEFNYTEDNEYHFTMEFYSENTVFGLSGDRGYIVTD